MITFFFFFFHLFDKQFRYFIFSSYMYSWCYSYLNLCLQLTRFFVAFFCLRLLLFFCFCLFSLSSIYVKYLHSPLDNWNTYLFFLLLKCASPLYMSSTTVRDASRGIYVHFIFRKSQNH